MNIHILNYLNQTHTYYKCNTKSLRTILNELCKTYRQQLDISAVREDLFTRVKINT